MALEGKECFLVALAERASRPKRGVSEGFEAVSRAVGDACARVSADELRKRRWLPCSEVENSATRRVPSPLAWELDVDMVFI
jgi:hypothetical protein